LPATLAEYRPDPAQPIDRWYQRADSANARTTRRIIKDLMSRPSAVIDPFCGAGSSAVAAREMGVPFIGVDIDPLLVCVTTAKARCDRRHLPLVDGLGLPDETSTVETSLAGPNGPLRAAASEDAFLSGCLALTVAASVRSMTAGVKTWVVQDATSGPGPAGGSEVRWGDAGTPSAWAGLDWLRPGWVVYGSPPFRFAGPTASEHRSPRNLAADLLIASGRASPPQLPPAEKDSADSAISKPLCRTSDGTDMDPYTTIVLSLLRRLRGLPAPGLVILEHEPPRPGGGDALSVARRVQLDGLAAGVEVLRTRCFSASGLLSLIVCEMR
jgi:hypothetical protein